MNEYGKFGRFYSAQKKEGGGDGAPLKIWKCKEGEHILDIIPFLAGPNHHQVREGEPTYLLDIWIHQKVGMDENDVVCLARNYNEACPICEYINAQRLNKDLDEDSEKALTALNPKRRCLYNVVCYDSTREESRGVQLWEVAHFLFEKKILSVARNPRGGGFVPFSSPDNGRSIYFEREGSGITNTQYLGHKFIERQSEITDALLEEAYVLDGLVIRLSYDQIKEALLGGLAKPEKKTDGAAAAGAEGAEGAGGAEGDTIPDDTNRVAQRMEAASKAKRPEGGPLNRGGKAPVTGAKTGRSAGGKQRPVSTQQRRPVSTQQRGTTGAGKTGEGKRPTAGQGRTSTQQRRKP